MLNVNIVGKRSSIPEAHEATYRRPQRQHIGGTKGSVEEAM